MRLIFCSSFQSSNRLLMEKRADEIKSVVPDLCFTISFLFRTLFRRKKIPVNWGSENSEIACPMLHNWCQKDLTRVSLLQRYFCILVSYQAFSWLFFFFWSSSNVAIIFPPKTNHHANMCFCLILMHTYNKKFPFSGMV